MVVKLDEDELIEHWTLVGDELGLVAGKRGLTRLGFSLLLKFYATDPVLYADLGEPSLRGPRPWAFGARSPWAGRAAVHAAVAGVRTRRRHRRTAGGGDTAGRAAACRRGRAGRVRGARTDPHRSLAAGVAVRGRDGGWPRSLEVKELDEFLLARAMEHDSPSLHQGQVDHRPRDEPVFRRRGPVDLYPPHRPALGAAPRCAPSSRSQVRC